jgi:hypothetical protein
MKAITLWQPWASLVADQLKTIETRSWHTKYRGVLAIHAGLKMDLDCKDACRRFGYDPKTIPRGAVLCTVMLVDCVQFPNPKAKPDEYGDFTDGRFGWLLEKVNRFTTPFPAKGGRMLWNWDFGDRMKQSRLI